MSESPDSRTLTPADLLDMIVHLRAEVTGLSAESAALKDEIRRLKVPPPSPTLKPGGMEPSSKRSSPAATGPKRRGLSRATVTEERRLCYEPPPGSRFGANELRGAGSGDRVPVLRYGVAMVTPTRRQIILGSGPHDAT
ncbi:hypothetical protein MPL3356_110409 [Mesorhizobium plurifarium]|uniref:Transposase n=1 Tax=Mesorhizobium plurifarium TaxID=69974 RepID=A0A090DAN9_MESPL|nr:hypothetical protein MPL3356_110409 [Mesorhizobium plurifarium]